MNIHTKIPFISTLNRLADTKWPQYLILGIITLVGAMLRLYRLGDWSFWIEELHTLSHAQSLDSLNVETLLSRDHFYLIIKLILSNFGESEWNARIFPMVLGVISIPLTYWFIMKLFGVQIAFITVFLLAISPWHIYWSQNARFYVYLLILYTISILAFYWGVEKKKNIFYGISLCTLGLAISTNEFAVILIIIFFVYFMTLNILNYEKPVGFQFRVLLYFIVIPFIIYLIYEAYRYSVGKTFLFIQIYNLFFNPETLSFIGLKNPYVMLTSAIYYIGVPLALLTIIGSYRLYRYKSRIGLLIIMGAYIPLIAMMFLTTFASTSNRYVFMTLPFWIVLAAVGAQELFYLGRKNVITLGLFFLCWIFISLKDPVIEDLLHYSGGKSLVVIFFGLILLGLISIIISFVSLKNPENILISYSRGIFILLPLIIHPIVTDIFYYEYQHGHRDNWKAVSEVVREHRLIEDPIVTYLPTLAEYYMGAPVINIKDVDLDEIIHQYDRIWFVEDETYMFLSDKYFDEWALENCILSGKWDQFTAGRLWKMRLFMCSEEI